MSFFVFPLIGYSLTGSTPEAALDGTADALGAGGIPAPSGGVGGPVEPESCAVRCRREDRASDNGTRDCSKRVIRLFAECSGTLEADEPENCNHDSEDDAAEGCPN